MFVLVNQLELGCLGYRLGIAKQATTTPIYRWGAFSPAVASDFTVVPGTESGAAKLLDWMCRKPRPEDMVHIVSYFQRELPGALCTHLDNLLKEKDEEVMVWLRWCAPKVKEMYAGR